jgi:hypothetical protein
MAFSEGPDGRLWIGTLGGGLNVFDQASWPLLLLPQRPA